MKIEIKVMLVILIIGLAYNWFYVRPKYERLKKNRKLVTGTIIETKPGFKAKRPSIKFEYKISEKIYTNDDYSESIVFYDLDNSFNGRSFPVAIDSTNYKNSQMLITPNHFKEFGLEFPDSLKWVLEYVK